MIVYQGIRDRVTGRLQIRRFDPEAQKIRRLNPRLDLFNHSIGFEIGYGGSGPAQTALAILADHLGDDDRAVRLHQSFKWAVIAKLDRDADFEISADDVDAWLDALVQERAAAEKEKAEP